MFSAYTSGIIKSSPDFVKICGMQFWCVFILNKLHSFGWSKTGRQILPPVFFLKDLSLAQRLTKNNVDIRQPHIRMSLIFSATTLADILERYNSRFQSTSTVNKTPRSVQTALSSLRSAYQRIFGSAPDQNFGDLTWLTLANLKQQNKSPSLRPYFPDKAHPLATGFVTIPIETSTFRKNLENFKSVLYALIQHLKTLGDSPEITTLMNHYEQERVNFDELSRELFDKEQSRLAMHRLTERQKNAFVPWTEIRRFAEPAILLLEETFDNPPDKLTFHANKMLQRALQLAIYVLIPPLRNDFARLRILTEDDEIAQELRNTKSPNYVVLDDDGQADLVINHYKTDGRSSSATYDPDQDFLINHPRTRRLSLNSNAVLQKFGFDPERLSKLFRGYYKLQKALFSQKNPHVFAFYDSMRDGEVRALTPEGMTTRFQRITQRMTMQHLGRSFTIPAQMLRTIFVSWLDSQRPSAEERLEIAKYMLHSLDVQAGTYTKQTQKNTIGRGRKRKITVASLSI